jgi:hypothetical protein
MDCIQTIENEHPGKRPMLYGFAIYAAACFVFLVYDTLSYQLPPKIAVAWVAIQGVVLLALAVWNVRLALMLFFVLFIFCDDIPRDFNLGGEVYNLTTLPLLGVTLGNWVALVLSGCAVVVALVRLGYDCLPVRPVLMDAYAGMILLVYALATLHGFGMVLDAPRDALSDLNTPVLLLALYVAVRLTFFTEAHIDTLWRVLMLAGGAKALVWMAWALLGMGEEFGTTQRVGLDSGHILFVLVLTYGLLLQLGPMGAGWRDRATGIVLVMATGGVLFTMAGRMGWLFGMVGLVTAFVMGHLRDRLRLAVLGLAGGVVVFFALLQVTPDMMQTIGGMASTLKFWDWQQVEASRSTLVRVYEFRNIHAQLVTHENLILGDGPGATFTDRYHPFPFQLMGVDYPMDEILARQFRKPHSLFATLMLKAGYGGMIGYLLAVGLMELAVIWGAWKERDRLRKAALTGLAAFMPAIVYQSWSPKNNMLLAVLLGIAGAMLSRVNKGEDTERFHVEP